MRTKTCVDAGCLSSSKQGIRFFSFPRDPARAAVWAGKIGISFTVDSAKMLDNNYLCSKHFLESDFTTAERVVAYQSLQQVTTLYWLQWGAVVNTWQQLFGDHLVNTFEAIRL
ncbi:uncharacterized protein LOC111874497 [Cryptotermes secundus]|uniref:uncharacterized protein LOC111874497 n=1 Tax=Cryptotermes secundus TaxID=105785 RepID=UPI000CD7D1CD|nr:uncharacterized protein LOC111874497 [Cryptotermes secundus]